MTTPNDELTGTTRPEIVGLALSGHLAAAAGGESHISQEDGEAVVGAVYTEILPGLQAEVAAEVTPAPAASASSSSSSSSSGSSSSA